MRTRCPCCGSTLSLDAFVANDAAREALSSAFKISTPLGGQVVRYLALFRPKSQELTFARVAKLLGEIVPDIQAQRINRDGTLYPAPVEAWLYAIDQALTARDDGRLKTPLKSHGYLYEVIAGWRGAEVQSMTTHANDNPPRGPKSKTLAGLAALENLKHG